MKFGGLFLGIMQKDMFYLREREYCFKSKEKFVCDRKKLWENLLGKEFVDNLSRNKLEVESHLNNSEWVINSQSVSQIKEYLQIIEKKTNKNNEILWENIESPFAIIYKKFIQQCQNYFEQNISKKQICPNLFHTDLLRWILLQMESIGNRILVYEMHLKAHQSNSIHNRYFSYVHECLENPGYTQELFSKYPVLERCLWECVKRNTIFFSEVVERLEEDKKEIEKHILQGKRFDKIESINGNHSDPHFSGRKVLQLRLDNGKSIVYKPRDLENEKWFGEFLTFLGKECGIKIYVPQMITRDGYGWVECVEQRECVNYKKLKRYYYRIGINLFASYLLGTNDIHCENLIAAGEYPIIVDLENLCKGIPKKKHSENNAIKYNFQNSVLSSGILPYYHWHQKGEGIDLSALAGGDDSKLPFKIPIIKNPNTEDMYVGYEHIKLKKKKNHALLKGMFISPDKFEKEISDGFSAAFEYTLNNKEEVRKWLTKIETGKSRYLIGDTQKYSMLLSSSYHPMVMKDAADREFLLYSLWIDRDFDNDSDCKIVDAEIYDLLNNDIPYFCFYMNQPNLYDSRGNQITDYFEEAPIKTIYRRLDSLDTQDLNRQKLWIHLSLSAFGEEYLSETIRYNHLGQMLENPKAFSSPELLNMAEHIADKLLEEAYFDKENLNWFRLIVTENKCGALNISSCGMYLYDGIAGNLVFLFVLSQYSHNTRYREACDMLEHQLFKYTDTASENPKAVQSGFSGLYNGEGSIVYTYLMLYWISRKPQYMEYAEKHAEILKEIADKDIRCDLLDGKAGAIMVFCYMYLSSQNLKYKKYAEQTAEKLMAESVEMEKGIGWKQADGGVPLLGMAHGNAGIMIAFSKLYELTENRQYYTCMKQALDYENNNFDSQTGNWHDFRCNTNQIDSVRIIPAAWCHGAGGILLSRLLLLETELEPEDREQVSEDIDKANTYMEQYGLRKEFCLCHGKCGNFLISDRYKRWKSDNNIFDNDDTMVSTTQEEKLTENGDTILTKEWFHPGLMNGYPGIGYYLLMEMSDIPDYIFLDVNLLTDKRPHIRDNHSKCKRTSEKTPF